MFRLAQKIASKSDHKQHHHAVIVTKGGAIVAQAHNKGETHAELNALEQLYPLSLSRVLAYPDDFPLTYKDWKGSNFTVYSFRWRKNGTWGNAKPCPACAKALTLLKIKKVYYTNDEGKLVRL